MTSCLRVDNGPVRLRPDTRRRQLALKQETARGGLEPGAKCEAGRASDVQPLRKSAYGGEDPLVLVRLRMLDPDARELGVRL